LSSKQELQHCFYQNLLESGHNVKKLNISSRYLTWDNVDELVCTLASNTNINEFTLELATDLKEELRSILLEKWKIMLLENYTLTDFNVISFRDDARIKLDDIVNRNKEIFDNLRFIKTKSCSHQS